MGDQTYTIAHFDNPTYLLGYLPRDSRLYLCDKDVQVFSYALSLRVAEYQTLVLRGDLDTANELLPDIPQDQLNKIARFLEGQGYKEQALEVATDPEHRFELALGLGRLDIALELAREADVETKWKTVGDKAMEGWDVKLAAECFEKANDLGSLLLVRTAAGDADGLKDLAVKAQGASLNNVAFAALWATGAREACIDLLLSTNRTAEAVLFSQTYMPSRTAGNVKGWKDGLEKDGKGRVARMLGMPPTGEEMDGVVADDDLFPEWEEWLRLEKEGGSALDIKGVDGTDGEDDEAEGLEEPAEIEANGEEEEDEEEAEE